jgi:hypothetical protein
MLPSPSLVLLSEGPTKPVCKEADSSIQTTNFTRQKIIFLDVNMLVDLAEFLHWDHLDRSMFDEIKPSSYYRRQSDKNHINTELAHGAFIFALLTSDSLLPWKLFFHLTNIVFLPKMQNSQACLHLGNKPSQMSFCPIYSILQTSLTWIFRPHDQGLYPIRRVY